MGASRWAAALCLWSAPHPGLAADRLPRCDLAAGAPVQAHGEPGIVAVGSARLQVDSPVLAAARVHGGVGVCRVAGSGPATCLASGRPSPALAVPQGTGAPDISTAGRLVFGPGDHHLGALTLGPGSRLRLSGEGTTRLFVDELHVGRRSRLGAPGDPGRLVIASRGDALLDRRVRSSGFVYAGGELGVGDGAVIRGGLSAAELTLGHRSRVLGGSTSASLGPLCDPVDGALPRRVVPQRSLIVHQADVLRDSGVDFSLRRVLGHIADSMGGSFTADPGRGKAETLAHDLWDLEREACPDEVGGWEHKCLRVELEGELAVDPSASLDAFQPVALVNRFDIEHPTRPETHCGEYRAIYAFVHIPLASRTFIILEAKLPNPTPELGREGCRPFQDFWAALSTIEQPQERAERLEAFFFDGVDVDGEAYPVFHWANYADEGGHHGQIRTNEFLNRHMIVPWVLKEHKLTLGVDGSHVQQVPVTNVPSATLFDLANTDPVAVAYRQEFLHGETRPAAQASGHSQPTHLENLLTYPYTLTVSNPDISILGGQDAFQPREFDFSESYSSQHLAPPDTFEHSQLLVAASRSVGGESFLDRIADQLASLRERRGVDCTDGSAESRECVRPEEVVRRASANTCAGCHSPVILQLNDDHDTVATSLLGDDREQPLAQGRTGFVHVSGELADGDSYALSPALTDVFLPERQAYLECFLNQRLFEQIDAAACAVDPAPGACAFAEEAERCRER